MHLYLNCSQRFFNEFIYIYIYITYCSMLLDSSLFTLTSPVQSSSDMRISLNIYIPRSMIIPQLLSRNLSWNILVCLHSAHFQTIYIGIQWLLSQMAPIKRITQDMEE